MDKADKVKHVLAAKQVRGHICHWPGCETQVPPALWGCAKHWRRIPKTLQRRIWNAYTPGQEITMNPSEEYIEAAQVVHNWIMVEGRFLPGV